MIGIGHQGLQWLIGGLVIGAYDTATERYADGVVAPRFFQGEAFEGEAYRSEVARVVEACLEELLVCPEDAVIGVCIGGVSADGEVVWEWRLSPSAMAGVGRWLAGQEADWRVRRDGVYPLSLGPLRERLEQSHWRHLQELGFYVDYGEYADPTRRGLVWREQIEWLKGGDADASEPDQERAAVCKTGRRSYEVWAYHSYREARRRLRGLGRQRHGWSV